MHVDQHVRAPVADAVQGQRVSLHGAAPCRDNDRLAWRPQADRTEEIGVAVRRPAVNRDECSLASRLNRQLRSVGVGWLHLGRFVAGRQELWERHWYDFKTFDTS